MPRKGNSPWPVLAFISFIFTAPYLIMKLLGTVTNTAQEEGKTCLHIAQPSLSNREHFAPFMCYNLADKACSDKTANNACALIPTSP